MVILSGNSTRASRKENRSVKFLIPFVLLIGTLIGCGATIQEKEQLAAHQYAILILAERVDEHSEALNGLASNDDAVKEILTIAKDLIEAMNERQKILDERQRIIMKELGLE